MKTIATLPSETAHLLKGRLESEQIPVTLLDEHSASAIPLSGGIHAAVRVQVADQDLERAKAIMQSVRESAPEQEEETEKFVSRAQPFLNAFEWLELVFTVLVVAAYVYRVFTS